MKFLFSLIIGAFLFSPAFAINADKIRVSSNGKTSKIELRFSSKSKRKQAAVFTVTNAEGKIMSTQNSDIICGDNAVCLCEALDLPEGTYTVTTVTKKKTYTNQFIIWK